MTIDSPKVKNSSSIFSIEQMKNCMEFIVIFFFRINFLDLFPLFEKKVLYKTDLLLIRILDMYIFYNF